MKDKFKLLIYAPIRWLNAECAYILTLLPKLKEQGLEIVLMGSRGNPILAQAKKLGVRIKDDFNLLSLNPFYLAKILPRLKKWLGEEEFDLISFHRSEGFFLFHRLAKKINPRPALVRVRQDMRPARTDPINKATYQECDLILVSNQLLAEDLKARLNLPPEKVKVVYLGIEPSKFVPEKSAPELRKEMGISPEARLIGISARLAPVKGHKYFLQSAQIISEKMPQVRFLVSYRHIEPESDFLNQLSHSSIKDKFLLWGENHRYIDLLSLCEVGVLSSVGSEASSRACLEWMALKKPVVATRVGVLPELVVPAETGYLVMPRDSQGMAEAILKLLRNPERAREMGERGYQRLLENFTEKQMVEQTIRYFHQVVEKVRGGL